MGDRPNLDELLGPTRNFGLDLAERMRGLGGLPAHLYRLGRIEQLLERARALARRVHDGLEHLETLDALIGAVNELIESHNRYFPIEANLPIDTATGLPRHGDRPFVPRPLLSRSNLIPR
jgi:hypothetical protein